MNQAAHGKLNHTYTIWGLILIAWAFYRVYVQLPEWTDELISKPLLFLGPVLWYVQQKERRPLASIGLSLGKLHRDIYLGLGFGMLFAIEGLIANLAKYGQFSFVPTVPINGVNLLMALVLALATAFSEEVLVRGFLYTRLKEGYKSVLKALFVSAAMYMLLLVPGIFVASHLNGATLVIFLMTNLVMSLANTMIYNETKTLTVPILIHAFWNMAVVLYL